MPHTLEEITSAMTAAVEMDKSIPRKFNASVLFVVDGNEHRLDARKKPSAKPADLSVQTSLETLQDLLDQKISPQQAFLKGKLKVKGKMSLAMKLSLVLDATRKHLNVTTARL